MYGARQRDMPSFTMPCCGGVTAGRGGASSAADGGGGPAGRGGATTVSLWTAGVWSFVSRIFLSAWIAAFGGRRWALGRMKLGGCTSKGLASRGLRIARSASGDTALTMSLGCLHRSQTTVGGALFPHTQHLSSLLLGSMLLLQLGGITALPSSRQRRKQSDSTTVPQWRCPIHINSKQKAETRVPVSQSVDPKRTCASQCLPCEPPPSHPHHEEALATCTRRSCT